MDPDLSAIEGGSYLFKTGHPQTVRLVDQDERGRVADRQLLF
jgi:hypothetical protein